MVGFIAKITVMAGAMSLLLMAAVACDNNGPSDGVGRGQQGEAAKATDSPEASRPSDCETADPHPIGSQLAKRFAVTYEEVMGYFCSGLGFGDVEQAYSASQEVGVSVEKVVVMFEKGGDWEPIIKTLGATRVFDVTENEE